MDKFFAELKNNPEFREEFFAFTNSQDKEMNEMMKQFHDHMNKQVMETFKRFAASKGMELQDSEAVKEIMAGICKKAAAELNEVIVQNCSMDIVMKNRQQQ